MQAEALAYLQDQGRVEVSTNSSSNTVTTTCQAVVFSERQSPVAMLWKSQKVQSDAQ
jgi:hypothetical protein